MAVLTDAEVTELRALTVDLGFADSCQVLTTSRIQGGTVYAVDLPYGTTIDQSAAILVNGARRLEVQGPPIDAGETAMYITAMAVERG